MAPTGRSVDLAVQRKAHCALATAALRAGSFVETFRRGPMPKEARSARAAPARFPECFQNIAAIAQLIAPRGTTAATPAPGCSITSAGMPQALYTTCSQNAKATTLTRAVVETVAAIRQMLR